MLKRKAIRVIHIDEEEEGDVSSLAVKELKDTCLTYHLPRSGNKSHLIARIVAHFESLSHYGTDGFQHLDVIVEDGT